MTDTAGGAGAAATSTAELTISEQVRQLDDARKLVLSDVSYYPTIIQGVLPIIGPGAAPELRRWGADFLAEAFASPALPQREKESLCLLVIERVKAMVEDLAQDVYVLRSQIQIAASIYPLAMRWIMNNSYDTPTWERMSAIKARILQIWDGAPAMVRLCCIKFAQRVVLAQTPATAMGQKRGGLDVSLAMVPPNHTLLDPRHLEAEATGLLDRMLGVIQDNSSDALVVDATLNALAVLVRTRPTTSNRILNAVLNFNPLKLANSPMTPKNRVLMKSMEKTTRMLLIHVSKRDPQNPLVPRMHQQIERLMRSRAEILDDTGRKRALAEQQAAAYGDAKRQRMEPSSAQFQITPLTPGVPHSIADIFTIATDPAVRGFHAEQLTADMAMRISLAVMAGTDSQTFDRAISGVRDRWASTAESQPAALNPNTAPLGVDEDDDDYEPDYYAAEDTEQILNKLDSSPAEEEASKATTASLALGTFKLPPPPTLTPDLTAKVAQGTVTRVFSVIQDLDDPTAAAAARKSRAGLNRLAASSYDRDAWITVITRLATRASAGLEDGAPVVKAEDDGSNRAAAAPAAGEAWLSNTIREALYAYVLEDFRKRIDVAVAWLCEEWYNDRLAQRRHAPSSPSSPEGSRGADAPPPRQLLRYDRWALRLLDGFLPYLHPQDKVLTRFLGEIPELGAPVLARVKALCRDPSLVPLALTSLLYLVMMRPPVRELALDAVQDIWTEFEDARPMAAKYLVKWRPGFLEANAAAPAAASGAAAAAAPAHGGVPIAT